MIRQIIETVQIQPEHAELDHVDPHMEESAQTLRDVIACFETAVDA